MFNWVVKVVPQPPEAPVVEEPVKPVKVAAPVKQPPKAKEAPPVKSPPLKNADEDSLDSQNQSGVLGWLSNGFTNSLPQPTGPPRLTRANGEKGSGVLEWMSQGLNNILPQPDEKYRESPVADTEEHTEVYDVQTMPDSEPLPHIPLVEMVSDDEDDNDRSSPFPPRMNEWIKHILPQPVTHPPGSVVAEFSNSSAHSSVDKILSPPPESLSGISIDTDGKIGGVVGWFVSGLGLKMPQPALAAKDDTDGAAVVLQKGGKVLQAP